MSCNTAGLNALGNLTPYVPWILALGLGCLVLALFLAWYWTREPKEED